MSDVGIWWWVVASIVAGSAPFAIAWPLVEVWERFNKKCRASNGPYPIRIPCASVSTDLMPLIQGLAKAGVPFEGSELWIFGSDGRYVVKGKSRPWQRQFRSWSKKGLKIKYILLTADPDVHKELASLKEKLGEKFDAVVLDAGAIPETARALETYHPTLFLGADGQNAAWIEGLHRRDSVYAYQVDYVSPLAMSWMPNERDRFQWCKDKLDLVVENSHRLTERTA